MQVAKKEDFDDREQLAHFQKYNYQESAENSQIIDLLQMDLTLDNISVALNIPEATLKDCNVETVFIEPVKTMKAAMITFRKESKYKLKNFIMGIKDFSDKYNSKYNGYLTNFIDKKDEGKFEKAVGLVERDLKEVLKTESVLEEQIVFLSGAFANGFTQFFTFAERLKGMVVKQEEKRKELEVEKVNNIKDEKKCNEEINVLQTHIDKQKTDFEKLKILATKLSEQKIDKTKEIEIGKVESQFCDLEITYHKQDESFLRKEIDALVSKMDAIENEQKEIEKENNLKHQELVKEKMALLKRNTEKKEAIVTSEKQKFGGVIDVFSNFVFGVRPIQAIKEKINGDYLENDLELKGINDEIANVEKNMGQKANYYLCLKNDLQKQLAEKLSKKADIENKIGEIKDSINWLEKQKSSLQKNEQSKIAAKTKILERLEATAKDLETTQKNLVLEKENMKKLEENRGKIENQIKETENEIKRIKKYINDLERLKLPPEFIQMVNNFSVAFNKLHDKLLGFKNSLTTDDGKLRLKFDTDALELEDDPWKLRIEYKQQIDLGMLGLKTCVEGEKENEKLLELLH